MPVTYNTICLTQTAATVAALMDFPAPAAAAEPIRVVLDAARERFGGAPVERMLLYNPERDSHVAVSKVYAFVRGRHVAFQPHAAHAFRDAVGHARMLRLDVHWGYA